LEPEPCPSGFDEGLVESVGLVAVDLGAVCRLGAVSTSAGADTETLLNFFC